MMKGVTEDSFIIHQLGRRRRHRDQGLGLGDSTDPLNSLHDDATKLIEIIASDFGEQVPIAEKYPTPLDFVDQL